MGVPLLVALLGDAAAGPVIGAIVIDLVAHQHAVPGARAGRSGALGGRRRAARGACGADRAARRAHQSAALGDRPRRGVRRAWAWSCPARWRRSSACSATRPRRWRCSRSARCCCAPAATSTRARRSATYLPVALIKLLVHPALVFGLGLGGARPRRAGVDLRPDGADPDRGAAEREQRLAAGRALRRRQRPGDADHHGLDHPRLRSPSRSIAWAFETG